MVSKTYIPERGDIVVLSFDPTVGHEQKGLRPVVVISPRIYNQASGLAICCPVTTKEKGYPFEIPITKGKIRGVVLVDQLRTLDYRERRASFREKIDEKTLYSIIEILRDLIT